MIIKEIDTIHYEVLCDYCTDSINVIKKSSYHMRSREYVNKDACSKCLSKKVAEVKEVKRIMMVEGYLDKSNSPIKRIPLSMRKNNGSIARSAIVDADIYEYLMFLCPWHKNANGYAIGKVVQEDGNKKHVSMHRVITECPPNLEVDHINGDRLDNRRENLRICERSQNIANMRPYIGKSSDYKGVSKPDGRKSFDVRIGYRGEKIRIGYFSDEIAAANAYNYHAVRLFGSYAKLNEVPPMTQEEFESYRVV